MASIRQSQSGLEWGVGIGKKKILPFQQLHQVLIEPIADKLPTNPEAHVIFIPQQSLFMIPFSPIQDASGKYLIEQHHLTIGSVVAPVFPNGGPNATRQIYLP